MGKFAPLHEAHVSLMKKALSVVDELIVLVYDCPDKISIPLNTRCDWVRRLLPGSVQVVEGWDAPNVHEDTEEVKRLQENYIGRMLKGRRITHFISSEYYGEHMSKYLNAVNYLGDPGRVENPISATKVRGSLAEYRKKLPKPVYYDILIKVACIRFGEESGPIVIPGHLAYNGDIADLRESEEVYSYFKYVFYAPGKLLLFVDGLVCEYTREESELNEGLAEVKQADAVMIISDGRLKNEALIKFNCLKAYLASNSVKYTIVPSTGEMLSELDALLKAKAFKSASMYQNL